MDMPNMGLVMANRYWSITFSTYGILAHHAFFFPSKNALEVSGFYNPERCFPLLKGEKMSYEFFQIL